MSTKLKLIIFAGALFLFIFVYGGALALGLFVGEKGGSSSSGVVTVADPKTKKEWEAIFRSVGATMKIPWEFLAAIMFQESGMGHNFGGCSYFMPAPAGGHVLTAGNGLRSLQDQTAFLDIVTKLSYPHSKPVSCNPPGSNGGAMGYMQVMPREWQSNAAGLVSAGLASGYPNPWKAQDSVMVGANILKGKVGIGTTQAFPESAETIKEAAGRYYGCTGCSYSSEVYAKYLEIKSLGHLP